MIKAKFIEIEGFGSIITKVVYKLSSRGLFIIYGDNGAGKSTIPNAIVWACYGRMLKVSKSPEPWEWIKGSEYKHTKVRFVFSKNNSIYEITRTLDKVFVKIDGKSLSHKGKRNINRYIIDLLGYSYDLFKNAIIFGQKMKRLMNEDSQTKKKILEETFETSFINRARDEVSTKLIKADAEYHLNFTKIENAREELAKAITWKRFYLNKIEEQKKELAIRTEELEKKIADLRDKIANGKLIQADLKKRTKRARRRRDEMESRIDRSLDNKKFKLEMEIAGIEDRIGVAENDIKAAMEAKRNVPRRCDKCGNLLKKDQILRIISTIKKSIILAERRIDSMAKEQAELKSQLRGMNTSIMHNEKKMEKHMNLVGRHRTLEAEQKNHLNEIKTLRKEIKIHTEYLKKLSEEVTDLASDLLNVQIEKINLHKKEILELNQAISEWKEKVETYNWLINDPLSNSGLKVFIFETMLTNINFHLSKYSKYMDFRIKLFIELESTFKNLEIRIWKGEEEIPYEDLSGGQQQLVDVALLFGLNDAITNTKPISFLFLDEVFESLTKDNIEKVSQLILDKSNEKSIHLITHTNSFPGKRGIQLRLNSSGSTEIV